MGFFRSTAVTGGGDRTRAAEAFTFTPAAIGTASRNTLETGIITLRAGVISAPGQNGHVYMEICPDNGAGAPNAAWIKMDYVGCRNNQAVGTGGTAPVGGGAGHIACSAGVTAIVPNGWWYRLNGVTIAGYTAPTFGHDGAGAGTYVPITV